MINIKRSSSGNPRVTIQVAYTKNLQHGIPTSILVTMEKDNSNKKSLSEQLKHTNSPVFSTAIFSFIMLLVVVGTMLSNMSLESTFFWTSPTSEVITMERKPLAPPKNSTSRQNLLASFSSQRIRGFQVNQPFREVSHQRVLESLNDECEVRFFMTWFSPADYFGKREFLAVESVFKSHPQGCLMIVSGSMDSPQGTTPDVSSLLENTPAKTWFQEMKSCKRDPGRIPLSQNLSNLARLAILYKYGGVYLDTDFIVTRSFKGLKNSIGSKQLWKEIQRTGQG
ncbi:hypothetical protein HID58_094123 [Brassica napus]|uniref:Alpha 1,4-glycosyltransferase domain-containing protein n=1 Tax=Brassica napus TaxID=3708 RepID=A0ABQ7X8F9_BRANA|nr:hypothetical protein HID58_094123 [Brassica napus]